MNKSVKNNKIKITVLAVILFLAISFSTNCQTSTTRSHDNNFRFIYSKDLFFNTKVEDAIALTKIFTEKIRKQRDIKEDVETVICENESEQIEAAKSNFDFALFSVSDFIRLQKKTNLIPVLVNQTQGNYGYVYYLISRKDRGFDDIKKLANCNLRILARNDGQTPSIWLEKLLRDRKLPKKEKFFKQISFDFVPTNVILPVFFKKMDAAIVTKASFELMCELNPMLSRELKVLAVSPTLLFGILCFDSRNTDKEREQFIYNILTTMHNDVDGQQFLNLFSLDKMIPYKEIYLTNFMELYK